MERTDILELMTTLKRYGMRAAYDEVMATGIKRRHEPPRIVGDLLAAEIAEKQARSIKYQLTIAKLPLAKDIDDFDFAGTPIMASNSDWVVPASYDERRFFVRNVAETYRGQREHFAAIGAQMDNGGLAAMIHEMLHRDISRFDVGAVPNTDALAEQKNLSLNTLDRWWLAVLERGFLWRSRHGIEAFRAWQDFCTTELLNRSYLQWCADNRVQRPESRELLGRRMTEIYGTPSRPTRLSIIGEVESATLVERQEGVPVNAHEALVEKQNSARGYNVGGLSQARAAFSQKRGVTGSWEPSR